MATGRQGLRFLYNIYKNLPEDILKRSNKQAIPKESAKLPSVSTIEQPVVSLEDELKEIKGLLQELLRQKRIKTVERDQDDLIVRVIDAPVNEGS